MFITLQNSTQRVQLTVIRIFSHFYVKSYFILFKTWPLAQLKSVHSRTETVGSTANDHYRVLGTVYR